MNIIQAKKMVEKDGLLLGSLSKELQDEREVVLAAVKQNGLAIQYASLRLRINTDIIAHAVSQNGLALQYVEFVGLKNEREIMYLAVQQNGLALQFASNQLKNDKNMVLLAIEENADAFDFTSNELKNDYEFILLAMKYHLDIFDKIDNVELKAKIFLHYIYDYSFVAGIDKCPLWNYFNSEIEDDFFEKVYLNIGLENSDLLIDIVITILKRGLYINSDRLPDVVINSKDVLKLLLKNEIFIDFNRLSPERKNDTDFISSALHSTDGALIINILSYNGTYIQYASYDVKTDPLYCSIAISNNSEAIKYFLKETLEETKRLFEEEKDNGKSK